MLGNKDVLTSFIIGIIMACCCQNPWWNSRWLKCILTTIFRREILKVIIHAWLSLMIGRKYQVKYDKSYYICLFLSFSLLQLDFSEAINNVLNDQKTSSLAANNRKTNRKHVASNQLYWKKKTIYHILSFLQFNPLTKMIIGQLPLIFIKW